MMAPKFISIYKPIRLTHKANKKLLEKPFNKLKTILL